MPLYIGLMSGTSMDAVDAILTDVSAAGIRALHSHREPIPPQLARELRDALDTQRLAAMTLWRLDSAVGGLFADAALGLLRTSGAQPSEVVAIGSHGQTLFHNPDGTPPITVQVGDPNVIAWRTGIKTVADFRRMDVAAGGQGAPLACAFHAAAFGREGDARAVLNIGGIANLTVLPASSADPVLGLDTGPGNTLMDTWTRAQLGADFDADGAWAAGGRVLPRLLDRLLADPYFARAAPKTTGRDYFSHGWLQDHVNALHGSDPRDVQRTLCELTARSAADALRRYGAGATTLLICGGGGLNDTLVAALAALLPGRRVCSTAELGIEPLAVEGAAFAWLAHETIQGRPGNLPSVTGAARGVVLGAVYQA